MERKLAVSAIDLTASKAADPFYATNAEQRIEEKESVNSFKILALGILLLPTVKGNLLHGALRRSALPYLSFQAIFLFQ